MKVSRVLPYMPRVVVADLDHGVSPFFSSLKARTTLFLGDYILGSRCHDRLLPYTHAQRYFALQGYEG